MVQFDGAIGSFGRHRCKQPVMTYTALAWLLRSDVAGASTACRTFSLPACNADHVRRIDYVD